MTKQLHEVLQVNFVDLIGQVWQIPNYLELVYVVNRHHFYEFFGIIFSKRSGVLEIWNLCLRVFYAFESLCDKFFQFRHFHVTGYAESHEVR